MASRWARAGRRTRRGRRARSPRTTPRGPRCASCRRRCCSTALRGARLGADQPGGIFPVGPVGCRRRRPASAHAGPAGAGGPRIVFGPARTRWRGRASHLGRGTAAGPGMGRRAGPAQPRCGSLTVPRAVPAASSPNPGVSRMRSNVNELRRAALVGRPAARWLALLSSCGGGSCAAVQVRADARHRLRRRDQRASTIRLSPGNGKQVQHQRHALEHNDPTIELLGFNLIWIQSVAAPLRPHLPAVHRRRRRRVEQPDPRLRRRHCLRSRGADRRAAERERHEDTAISPPCWSAGNDVINQYLQYPTVSEPVLIGRGAGGRRRGRPPGQPARQLRRARRRLDDARRRLYAVRHHRSELTHVDTDRQALLQRLNLAFNSSLRSTITQRRAATSAL